MLLKSKIMVLEILVWPENINLRCSEKLDERIKPVLEKLRAFIIKFLKSKLLLRKNKKGSKSSPAVTLVGPRCSYQKNF